MKAPHQHIDPQPDETPGGPMADYAHWVASLRAAVSESVNGVVLRAARPVPLRGTGVKFATSTVALVGFSFTETTGSSAATVTLSDGSGDLSITITLSAGQSVREWWGPGGVQCTEGLTPTITGAVSGAAFIRGAE